MSIKLIQHLMQQITLKVNKLVNKIIFRSNNAKHHSDQWQYEYCQFKANFYIAKWGLMGNFSIALKFVHLCSHILNKKKIEPQKFEIFQFKNCKEMQNQVVKLKSLHKLSL